jgi:hypothetical protein
MEVLLSPTLLQITSGDPLGHSSLLVSELWFLLFLQIVYSYYLDWNILVLFIRLAQLVRYPFFSTGRAHPRLNLTYFQMHVVRCGWPERWASRSTDSRRPTSYASPTAMCSSCTLSAGDTLSLSTSSARVRVPLHGPRLLVATLLTRACVVGTAITAVRVSFFHLFFVDSIMAFLELLMMHLLATVPSSTTR